MSTDYYTYVGAFIRVNNPKLPSSKKYYSCPKEGCTNHKKKLSHQYCPKCGTLIALVEVPTMRRTEFNIYNEFDESLAEIAQHYGDMGQKIYVSNTSNRGAGKVYDSRMPNIISIAPDAIPAMIAKMEQDFANEISKLKKVFGENAVKVQCGVVNYVS